jgi:hypothetical protein
MNNTWGQEYIRRYTVYRTQSKGVKAHPFLHAKKGEGLTGKRMRGSAGQHSQPSESRTVLELGITAFPHTLQMSHATVHDIA